MIGIFWESEILSLGPGRVSIRDSEAGEVSNGS